MLCTKLKNDTWYSYEDHRYCDTNRTSQTSHHLGMFLLGKASSSRRIRCNPSHPFHEGIGSGHKMHGIWHSEHIFHKTGQCAQEEICSQTCTLYIHLVHPCDICQSHMSCGTRHTCQNVVLISMWTLFHQHMQCSDSGSELLYTPLFYSSHDSHTAHNLCP